MPTLTPTEATGARSVPWTMTYVDPARQLPPDEHDTFLAGTGLNGPFVADLLSDMTAHERCGAALYRSVRGALQQPGPEAEVQALRHQTVEHVEILEELVTRLGGDPGYVSPAARATERTGIALLESTFLLGGSVDLMTAELVMLDAVLLAEAMDHANWSGLAQLADGLPEGEVRDAVRAAVDAVEPAGGRAPRLGAGHAHEADQHAGPQQRHADRGGQGRGDGGPRPGPVRLTSCRSPAPPWCPRRGTAGAGPATAAQRWPPRLPRPGRLVVGREGDASEVGREKRAQALDRLG